MFCINPSSFYWTVLEAYVQVQTEQTICLEVGTYIIAHCSQGIILEYYNSSQELIHISISQYCSEVITYPALPNKYTCLLACLRWGSSDEQKPIDWNRTLGFVLSLPFSFFRLIFTILTSHIYPYPVLKHVKNAFPRKCITLKDLIWFSSSSF